MKKNIYILLVILTCLYTTRSWAQETDNNSDAFATDYSNIVLPPLSILYENAQKTPAIDIYEVQKKYEEQMLKKEKRAWLNYLSVRGSYTYGKTDNYASQSDLSTPIFYQYTGMAQNYYNVGANISIPIEHIFDLKGKNRRQKLKVEQSQLSKEAAMDILKQDISRLYAEINSNLIILKVAGESVAMARGAYQITEDEFKAGNRLVAELSEMKKDHLEAVTKYEGIRMSINATIFQLEILSNTPILSK